MTREKALEAMDKLVSMGYHAHLSEYDMGEHGYFMIEPDETRTTIKRDVYISEMSVDKVDIKALVAAADELGLDVGWSPMRQNVIAFYDPTSPEEQHRRSIVEGKRRHPR